MSLSTLALGHLPSPSTRSSVTLTLGHAPSEWTGGGFGFSESADERGAASVVIPFLEGESGSGDVFAGVTVDDVAEVNVNLPFAEMQ